MPFPTLWWSNSQGVEVSNASVHVLHPETQGHSPPQRPGRMWLPMKSPMSRRRQLRARRKWQHAPRASQTGVKSRELCKQVVSVELSSKTRRHDGSSFPSTVLVPSLGCKPPAPGRRNNNSPTLRNIKETHNNGNCATHATWSTSRRESV